MSSARLIGLGLACFLVGCGRGGTTGLSSPDGGGSGARDAAERLDASRDDASAPDSGLDATTPDATVPPGPADCAAWCTLELACRASELERDVGNEAFGVGLACFYPSPDEALTRCVAACSREVFGSVVPEPCLTCWADNLRESCAPSRSWANCTPTCGMYGIEPLRRALRDDLSCRPESALRGSPECRPGFGELSITRDGRPQSLDAAGVGTVVGVDPLRFVLDDGRELTITERGLSLPVLTVGDVLRVEAHVECPFWCESRLVVRRLGGALRFAAWSGRLAIVPRFPEVTLVYVPSPCNWTRDMCSEVLAADLVVTTSNSTGRVGTNGTVRVNDLTIIHAQAARYFEPQCTDIPYERVVGAVIGPP